MPVKEQNQARIHKPILDTVDSSTEINTEECDQSVDCGVEIFNNEEKVAEKEKDKCGSCKIHVKDRVECEICQTWFHVKCINLNVTTIKLLDTEEAEREAGH